MHLSSAAHTDVARQPDIPQTDDVSRPGAGMPPQLQLRTLRQSGSLISPTLSVRQRSMAPPQGASSVHTTALHSDSTAATHAPASRLFSLHATPNKARYELVGCLEPIAQMTPPQPPTPPPLQGRPIHTPP